MIEMVYKGNSEEKRENQMGLPKNIRQIGESGEDKKVYLEDYAATFLMENECAILLGECTVKDGIKYIFVNGAVAVRNYQFDDESWSEIYQDTKTYFKDKEILGWSHRIEEADQEVTEEWEDIHRIQFPGEDRLLFLACPKEECGTMYVSGSSGLKKQNGYYIYYEKNEAMQNYMVEKNEGHSVEQEEPLPDNAIASFRKKLSEKKKETENTSRTSLPGRFLYTACMLLALTILVIGAAMVRNYTQMKEMKQTLSEMAQLKEETEWQVSASADDSLHKKMKTETEMETEINIEIETESGSSITWRQGQTETQIQESDEAQAEKSQSTGEAKKTETQQAVSSSASANKMQAEYTIKVGDTLADVCRMYYGSIDKLEEICELNGITDPNTIMPGQKLVLP